MRAQPEVAQTSGLHLSIRRDEECALLVPLEPRRSRVTTTTARQLPKQPRAASPRTVVAFANRMNGERRESVTQRRSESRTAVTRTCICGARLSRTQTGGGVTAVFAARLLDRRPASPAAVAGAPTESGLAARVATPTSDVFFFSNESVRGVAASTATARPFHTS